MTDAVQTIDPSRRYTVSFARPVRYRLVTFRPDQEHLMSGALVLALLQQEGVPEASADALLTATPVEG